MLRLGGGRTCPRRSAKNCARQRSASAIGTCPSGARVARVDGAVWSAPPVGIVALKPGLTGHLRPSAPIATASGIAGARPADQAGRRARALEALSGTGTFDGDGTVGGEVMRAFAEVADADRHGYDERWAYAPGPLARIREAARLTWPSALPEPMRTAYREKAAQARAAAWAEANQRAIADAEAQVKQAGWR